MLNRKEKVRIIDIAKALSVSPATVSLAIHNKNGVSEKVRESVLKKCEELGYPLAEKTSSFTNMRMIRLCVYKKHGQIVCETPFFSELIEGMENEARRCGYELLISYYNEMLDSQEKLNQVLLDKESEGIILLATEMQEADLIPFKEVNSPLLILDNVFKKTKVKADYVLIDNVNGMYDITEYLIKNGHHKIGYAKSIYEINNFKERQKGYKLALQENRIEFNEKYIYRVGSTVESAFEKMKDYLNPNEDFPSAIVADNDIIAFGVIQALKDYGLEIPNDISIVGFDEMQNFSVIESSLSTVRVPKRAMGRAAVRQLVRAIEDRKNDIVDCSIVLRVQTELALKNSVLRCRE